MIFLSKVNELRLVMKPTWVTKDPLTGVVVHPGRTLEFFQGRYETDDQDEIEFIKSRPGFGTRITAVESGDLTSSSRDMITGSVGAGRDPHKRSFTCTQCGITGFESGFEIAKHRKSGECAEIQGLNKVEETSENKEE